VQRANRTRTNQDSPLIDVHRYDASGRVVGYSSLIGIREGLPVTRAHPEIHPEAATAFKQLAEIPVIQSVIDSAP
jgi:hypothetical protein